MFYLIQHIWFLLLVAAALGAFLMWLVRTWSKEETLSALTGDWQERFDALKNENSLLKLEVQTATNKTAQLATLQTDIERHQQNYAALSTQHDKAEEAWSKRWTDLEREGRDKRALLEDQLTAVRAEFTSLSNERDGLATQVQDHSRQSAALEAETQEARRELGEWRERFSKLEAEAAESRTQLGAITSECDTLREAGRAQAAVEQDRESLRQNLAEAQQELSMLRSAVDQSRQSETEWREKCREAEERCARANVASDESEARLQEFAGIQIEKNRAQAEAAALASRVAQLQAQIDETQVRVGRLSDENQRLRQEENSPGQNGIAHEELRGRLSAAEQDAVSLRSHLATASYLQDEWRAKWHDAENKHSAAQEKIAELTARVGALAGLQVENMRLQNEVASWSSKYTLLRAEADVQFSKLKDVTDRLAALAPEQPDDKENGWRIK